MSPIWEQYYDTNPVRMVLMQDSQNLTGVSDSYMERRPDAETVRSSLAISHVDYFVKIRRDRSDSFNCSPNVVKPKIVQLHCPLFVRTCHK